jgi:hypothetical protein
MVRKWQFWLLMAAAASAIVLAIINVTLFFGNRRIQTEISGRQQFIQQSIQLEGLYRDMVKALADLSAKNSDEQLRKLLETHGITFSRNPSAPPDRSKAGKK